MTEPSGGAMDPGGDVVGVGVLVAGIVAGIDVGIVAMIALMSSTG